MQDLNCHSHKFVFIITRWNRSFRFKREDCVLSPKSTGSDHPETTRRYILPFPCILVNPHDIILAFSLFSDQVARSAKPCLHFPLRREAWPREGRRAISKSRFQFRFLLHGERKSRVWLSSRGAGAGRPSGITGIAQTRLETRAKIRNPNVSALCIDRPSFLILIFLLSLSWPIQ